VPIALALLALACAPPRAAAPLDVVLLGEGGAPHPLRAELATHRFTVVTFFSAHCPCQRMHDARLQALIAKDSPRGVGFLIVDSEHGRTAEGDAAEQRGYPIFIDPRAELAHALDAEYATFSVIVDPSGHILYRGGFDSDRSHLRPTPTSYLETALDDLLAGHPPRWNEAKTLGCSLELD
jgi:hypothetical protein